MAEFFRVTEMQLAEEEQSVDEAIVPGQLEIVGGGRSLLCFRRQPRSAGRRIRTGGHHPEPGPVSCSGLVDAGGNDDRVAGTQATGVGICDELAGGVGYVCRPGRLGLAAAKLAGAGDCRHEPRTARAARPTRKKITKARQLQAAELDSGGIGLTLKSALKIVLPSSGLDCAACCLRRALVCTLPPTTAATSWSGPAGPAESQLQFLVASTVGEERIWYYAARRCGPVRRASAADRRNARPTRL